MQPLVRSTSPVAEHDQRIGMTDFEEFEFGESPFATADSEAELEETGALQTPMLPTITAASDVGKTTVQRKMASPSATPVGPTTPAAPRKSVVAGEEWSIFSTDATREHEPIPGSSQARSASRGVGYGAVRTRSLQQARQADSNFLEPLPYALAEHIEQTPTGSSMSTGDAGESPRIVIGRINVEVVPAPAAQPRTTAPRPGPLTAASVSVIGPLGGGIRPNLRLSLRHR